MERPACPACSERVRASARFCRRCGASLTPSAFPPPAGEETSSSERAAGRSARDWKTFRAGTDLFALLLLSSLVTGLLTRSDANVHVLAVATVVDALVIVAFAFRERARLRTLWGPPRMDRAALPRLLAVVALSALAVQGYFWLLRVTGAPFARYTDDFVDAGWPTWSIYLLISAVPAVFEEIAFRGVIQGTFERLFSPRQALVMQAALFSAAHLLPLSLPSHFVLGLAFGHVRNKTGSLYAGMALHALWNAAVVFAELG